MILTAVEFAGGLTAAVWVIVQLSKPKKKVWKSLPQLRAEKRADRLSPKYKAWRLAVLRRDQFTCQKCGKNQYTLDAPLEAHHLKPFAYFPQLRFDVSNGQALCHSCHVKTDSYGSKAKQNYGSH